MILRHCAILGAIAALAATAAPASASSTAWWSDYATWYDPSSGWWDCDLTGFASASPMVGGRTFTVRSRATTACDRTFRLNQVSTDFWHPDGTTEFVLGWTTGGAGESANCDYAASCSVEMVREPEPSATYTVTHRMVVGEANSYSGAGKWVHWPIGCGASRVRLTCNITQQVTAG